MSSFVHVWTFGPLKLSTRCYLETSKSYTTQRHITEDQIPQLHRREILKPRNARLTKVPRNLVGAVCVYHTCAGVAGAFNLNSVTMLITKRPGMTLVLLITKCLQLHAILTDY